MWTTEWFVLFYLTYILFINSVWVDEVHSPSIVHAFCSILFHLLRCSCELEIELHQSPGSWYMFTHVESILCRIRAQQYVTTRDISDKEIDYWFFGFGRNNEANIVIGIGSSSDTFIWKARWNFQLNFCGKQHIVCGGEMGENEAVKLSLPPSETPKQKPKLTIKLCRACPLRASSALNDS